MKGGFPVTDPSALKIIDNRMERLTALKIVENRMKKLTNSTLNSKHAERFAEERDQLSMISDELRKLETKSSIAAKSSPELDELRQEMALVARKVAAMGWDDPQRHDVLNEFTRLAMISDSIDRYER